MWLPAQPLAEQFTFITLAGPVEPGPGARDGLGDAARFSAPHSLALDVQGNRYVADRGNHTIRKITPDGAVTTLAGSAGESGFADGSGAAARLNGPSGVAVDSHGTVYVADYFNHAIRRISSLGVVTTLAGNADASGGADGSGAAARFGYPTGIAVDKSGTLFVADGFNHTIRKISSSGIVSTVAGTTGIAGNVDNAGAAARFNGPSGIVADNAGNLYVTDYYNHTVRRLTTGGVVTTLAGQMQHPGTADGTGSKAQFSGPSGLAIDRNGILYVTDAWSDSIRRITAGGTVTTLAVQDETSIHPPGSSSLSPFAWPAGLAVDETGNLHVADQNHHRICHVNPAGGVTIVAGCAIEIGAADGLNRTARFGSDRAGQGPSGVAVDAGGAVYVSDTINRTIRRISPAGMVTTLAGSAGSAGSADGIGTGARFAGPTGVAVDRATNVFIVDSLNQTIRVLTTDGWISTLTGYAGQTGNSDGLRSEARFSAPLGIAVDNTGMLYVADYGNHAIRAVTSWGTVSTLAGNAEQSGDGDGPAAIARFAGPAGVTVDGAGNLFVADSAKHTIRKISVDGIVSTLAGRPGESAWVDATGNLARLNNPRGLVVDAAGNVFIADTGNHALRQVTPDGQVITLAGRPDAPGSDDGSDGMARFNQPWGLALDAQGRLYIADSGNANIRLGVRACSDKPVIDTSIGLVGKARQLDTSPATAQSWQWTVVRRPSGSTAELSVATIRNPTFVPDVADRYVFRLTATDATGGIAIRTLAFTATNTIAAAPRTRLEPPVRSLTGLVRVQIDRIDGSDGLDADLFRLTAQASVDLVNWASLTNALRLTNSLVILEDPDSLLYPRRFYRLLGR